MSSYSRKKLILIIFVLGIICSVGGLFLFRLRPGQKEINSLPKISTFPSPSTVPSPQVIPYPYPSPQYTINPYPSNLAVPTLSASYLHPQSIFTSTYLPIGPLPSVYITATIKTIPDLGQGISAYDFLDEKHGWVATGLGWTEHTPDALLSTQDGGKTWKILSNEIGKKTNRISFISAQQGWRIYSGKVQTTQDGGKSWSPVLLGQKNDYAIDLQFVDPQDGWVITGSNDLLSTHDGGQNWKPLPKPLAPAPGGWRTTNFIDPLHGWAVFADDGMHSIRFLLLVETQDGGRSWHTVYDPNLLSTPSVSSITTINSISFIDSEHGWLSNGLDIYATQDGGKTWQVIHSEHTNPLYDVRRLGDSNGYSLVDASGVGWVGLMRTLDGGQTWTQIYPPLYPLGEIQFFDSKNGIGIGTPYNLGAILKTIDGGRSWKLSSSIGKDVEYMQKLSFADPEHGWAIVQDCLDKYDCGRIMLYGTDDGGQTWERRQPIDINDIDLVSPFIGYMLQQDRLNISQDAGRTFELIPGIPDLTQIAFADIQKGWGLGQDGILATTDGGYHWKIIPLGFTPSQLNYVPGGVGWVKTKDCFQPDHCRWLLLKTEDDGHTWKAIVLPRLDIEELKFSTALDGWIRGGEHSDLKAGYLLGVDHLYVTHDGGYSWEQVR